MTDPELARQQAKQLETLTQLGRLLCSSHDLDYVKAKATEAAVTVLNCEASSLLLVNGDGRLEFDAVWGGKGAVLRRFYVKPGQGIAGWVALHGSAVIAHQARNDPRFCEEIDEATDFVTRNIICVPLKARDEIIGVIEGINKLDGDFTSDDLNICQSLANQIAIAVDNARLFQELQDTTLQLLQSLSNAIDKRDAYTGGHTQRVVAVSMAISDFLCMEPEDKRALMWAAVLHDVGKVGISDDILNKTGPLSDEEFTVMMTHPQLCAEILAHIRQLELVIPGIKYHHERCDGSGYPEGLTGDQIPLIAKVIAVADAYDAMITDRPYQKGMDRAKAKDVLQAHAGILFDAAVVEAFLKASQKYNF
jgi:response regulator RpfG family c-di-GMP phosphodiesterase